MKIYPEIIKNILENARESGQNRISLVDVISQYDARNKLAPLLDEINEALKDIDWISTSKDNKELFLNFTVTDGGHVSISGQDFKWADKEYRRRFWKAHRKTE